MLQMTKGDEKFQVVEKSDDDAWIITYPKIRAIFNRNPETKAVEIGKFSLPVFEYMRSNMWDFSLKVDGTNTRIIWNGERIVIRGHTNNAAYASSAVEFFKSTFLTDEFEELMEQSFGSNKVILFGETYGAKIQGCGGKYDPKEDHFALFDVYFPNGNWLDRDKTKEVAAELGLSSVPTLLTGTLDDGIKFVQNAATTYDPLAKTQLRIEGIVGRTKEKIMVFDSNLEKCVPLMVKIKCKDILLDGGK